MRVLIVGSGGREHAIAWKLGQSTRVSHIFCAPGNGGIEEVGECVDISEHDIDKLIHFAKEKKIDLTVIGPEVPLLNGICDRFEAEGLKVFGPSKLAARIEGSKRYAKELMHKYQVPTATYQVFTEADEAKEYVLKQGAPIVIKADGLAAGKGVVVAQTSDEALKAIQDIMEKKAFGKAGHEVVIEQFLTGEEVSLMAFVDGKTFIPMVEVQDHKPVYDDNKGPNTGGMGTYSPVPQIKQNLIEEAINTILKPIVEGMNAEGIHYKGVLYAGLMITEEGPKVIEFNARFGDPETQVVLPRLSTDLLEILLAVVNGSLDGVQIEWRDAAAVCVVMTAEGYPASYPTGIPIHSIPVLTKNQIVFHAGTRRNEQDQMVTTGGRVLGVTGIGDTLTHAREKAYCILEQITFKGCHYRKDIAGQAIATKNDFV
ncbi:phosphoribosylamine--glycine ligase [Hazenella sp. IB182357]|uniref:Phosphoribosylamine--glycine ligase n=1 Tax=Polycladospora coralii TaxID=2771432 RepID=A0A926NCL9_9BACL|nr:phosphoribosylamine--glycine ligase [Polycladospora coralii]MBD1373360.1 phosphoribosylamine--glycine ligase [Polycladospora coralii]